MSDAKHVRLVGGRYANMKVYDPKIIIHEGHVIEVTDAKGDEYLYQVNREGDGVTLSLRSRAARNATVVHPVNQKDLVP